jgi:RHS repeat-associated protein
MALVAISLSAVLLLPSVASAAECTDTWTGSAPGSWEAAESWSAEHAPSAFDVACIPSGKVVEVSTGANEVKVLQGEGELHMLSGSLAIHGAESSNIGTLHLSGGALKGSAQLFVTKTLTADGGSTESEGETVIGLGAEGRVEPIEGEGPGLRVAQKSSLTVKGSLVVAGAEGKLNVIEGALLGVENGGSLTVGGPEGRLTAKESAEFVNSASVVTNGPSGQTNLVEHASLLNEGSYVLTAPEGGLVATGNASIENTNSLKMEGSEGEIRLEETALVNTKALRIEAAKGRLRGSKEARVENSGTLAINGEEEGNGLVQGSGVVSKLINNGTVRKDEGEGMAFVEFKTDNESLVKAESGTLTFTGGGNSGQEAKDKWVSEEWETGIDFVEGAFTLGEHAEMRGDVVLWNEASAKGHQIDGEEAQVMVLGRSDFEITGAKEKSSFEGLSMSSGHINVIKNGQLSAQETFVDGGRLEFGSGSDIFLEDHFQTDGRVNLDPGATLEAGGVFLEGDSRFALKANTDFEFEDYFQEDQADASLETGASLTGNDIFVSGGTLELRKGTENSSGQLFQEGGTTHLGEDTSLDSNEIYVEGGKLETGTNSTYSTEEFFLEHGATSIGKEAALESDRAFLERGVLKGEGTLLTKGMYWEETVMKGDGLTSVTEFGIQNGSSCALLEHRSLLLLGTYSIRDESTLMMSNGAHLINDGPLEANSENGECGPQVRVDESSTSAPKIINRSTFYKAAGTGTTTVTVPFENQGRVGQISGTLKITNRLGVPTSQRFGQRCNCGDPVETASGDLTEAQTDIDIGGRGVGLSLSRAYSAQAAASASSPGIFGYGWSYSFGDRLVFEEEEVEIAGDEEGEVVEEEANEEEEVAEEEAEEKEELEEVEGEPEEESEEEEPEEEAEGGEPKFVLVKRIVVERANGSTVPFTEDAEGNLAAPEWSQDTLVGNPEVGYTYTSADQIKRHFAPGGALQIVTDRNGNETTLAYDEAGQLEAITDPVGRQINLAYDEEGFVESAEDPMGHLVKYTYEGGDLASVTMPGEKSPRWQFKFDGSHRMTKVIDGRGGETANGYDEENRVIVQTDPAKRTLAFEYEGFHTRITNLTTGSVTDQWFNSDNEPTTITDGFGTKDASTGAFVYDEAGHLLSETDGNGHTTTYAYNAAGDRTSATDPDKDETKWEYNAAHDLISETTPNGETTTIVRDGQGNPETISRQAPGKTTQTTSFTYGAYGQRESMTDPLEHTWHYEYDSQGDLSGEIDPEGGRRTWEYDEDSRLTSTVSPRGNEKGAEASEFTTSYERDPQGRPIKVTDPLGNTTEYAYDGNGNVKTETDGNGHTTTYAYDADDEPVEVKAPNGVVTKTEYDGAGKVIAQIDGNGHTTEYVRNVLEQPIEMIDPLKRATVKEYDAAGNLIAKTNPQGRTTSYSYDPANRLREVSYSDETTPPAEFSYDKDGNLIDMSDGTGESSYEYDQLDRLIHAEDGHGETVSYEYNLANQQTGITYPNGKGVEQGFDKAGRMNAVTDWLGNTTRYSYDADSNIESTTFPEGTGNVDEYGYDHADRMSGVQMKQGSETLASLGYSRDKVGNIEGLTSKGLPGAEEEAFSYDKNNRVIEAGTERFEYDPANNLTEDSGVTNFYDAANELEKSSDATYAYDEEGERIKTTPLAGASPVYDSSIGGKGSGAGDLAAPAALALDTEGNVWVADTGNDRVQKFNAKGEYLAQFGTEGTGNGQLSEPEGLTLDSKGDVWVADTGNDRVQEFGPEGTFIAKVGTEGTGNGQFKAPSSIALDTEGNVWVADTGNDRVQKFNAKGEYLAQFGTEGTGNGQLSEPEGLTLDSKGDVWVADTGNDRVDQWLRIKPPTSYAYDQAGNLTAAKRPAIGEALKIDETYAYDGAGLRVSQTVSGTTSQMTWNTSIGLPLLLSDGEGNYVYGPDGLPVEQISTKEVSTYYHHDQLGSVRLLTDPSGAPTATYTYSAYGQLMGSAPQVTPFGYAGQYTNEQDGLQNLRARSYEPTTGQFLTRDPIEALTGQPYAYTADNPINGVDPTGLISLSLPSPGEVVETIAHAALDTAAVLPYAKYYAANRLANAISSVGNKLGLPGEVVAHGLNLPLALVQAEGLCEDALIDWVKGHTVNNESIRDEGKVGYINPFHEFLPGPLKGPKTYLPGIHENGKIDIGW